jgi:Domain of unknown function (DUF4189)
MHNSILAVAVSAFVTLVALPAVAEPVVYAANERGAIGGAIGFGTNAEAENKAMGWCGGAAAGCKIVMSADGDCIAAAASDTSAGYWYYIGYTVAENAYNRSGELQKVRDMVLGWCTAGDAPSGTCKVVHSDCAGYLTNLN